MSKKPSKSQKSISDLAEEALLSAFAKLVKERQKFGGTLVFWENGRVVHVPASEVVLPRTSNQNGKHFSVE